MDSATRFKKKSLAAIDRRKKIEKVLYGTLIVMAVVMGTAVAVVYFFD